MNSITITNAPEEIQFVQIRDLSFLMRELGDNFRGLWKSVTIENGVRSEGWACTFVIGIEMIDNSYFNTPEEALENAIEVLISMR